MTTRRRRRRRFRLDRFLASTNGNFGKSSRWEANRPKKRKGKWLSSGRRR